MTHSLQEIRATRQRAFAVLQVALVLTTNFAVTVNVSLPVLTILNAPTIQKYALVVSAARTLMLVEHLLIPSVVDRVLRAKSTLMA